MSAEPDSTTPSAFAPSQPSSFGPSGARSGGTRFRHRSHALAPEREYRVGQHTLRWHDADRPDRGAGQLALSQISSMRLEVVAGQAGARRGRLTLQPRGHAAPLVIESDSAEGWLGRRAQPEAYRRFVRTLHGAAVQVRPQLRVESAPPSGMASLAAPMLALLAATALGLLAGPLPAFGGLLLTWPIAARVVRWRRDRGSVLVASGGLPRQLLP